MNAPVLVFSHRGPSALNQQERELLRCFRECDAERRERLLYFADVAAQATADERDEAGGA